MKKMSNMSNTNLPYTNLIHAKELNESNDSHYGTNSGMQNLRPGV